MKTVIIFALLVLASQASAYHPIIGYVDVVAKNYVNGWTCHKGVSISLDVHLYVVSSHGNTIVKSAHANLHSEDAVSQACGTGYKKYRYTIPLSDHERHAHHGKKVIVYGISVINGVHNMALTNSGRYSIP